MRFNPIWRSFQRPSISAAVLTKPEERSTCSLTKEITKHEPHYTAEHKGMHMGEESQQHTKELQEKSDRRSPEKLLRDAPSLYRCLPRSGKSQSESLMKVYCPKVCGVQQTMKFKMNFNGFFEQPNPEPFLKNRIAEGWVNRKGKKEAEKHFDGPIENKHPVQSYDKKACTILWSPKQNTTKTQGSFNCSKKSSTQLYFPSSNGIS